MYKKKYEMVDKRHMPIVPVHDVLENLESTDRFFVSTPDINNLGYDVIRWLHENPETK